LLCLLGCFLSEAGIREGRLSGLLDWVLALTFLPFLAGTLRLLELYCFTMIFLISLSYGSCWKEVCFSELEWFKGILLASRRLFSLRAKIAQSLPFRKSNVIGGLLSFVSTR